jgi:hypothetical protein
MAKKHPRVGIIAEDDSDVETVAILIHRLANNQKIGIRRTVGHGCGKIHRKCNAWANNLKQRGCNYLVVIHDLDRKQLNTLYDDIKGALYPCPIKRHVICIPIQELEAWLLSDPVAIQTALNLGTLPKVVGILEYIDSPKEYLGKLIDKTSQGSKVYINTQHNALIAAEVSMDSTRTKCPSFVPFYNFVQSNLS